MPNVLNCPFSEEPLHAVEHFTALGIAAAGAFRSATVITPAALAAMATSHRLPVRVIVPCAMALV